MIDRLDLLEDYMYYFQFTINSYGQDIEANIPSKNDVIIPTFRDLSDMIGPERIIWRYDPILLTEKYSKKAIATQLAATINAVVYFCAKVPSWYMARETT